MTPRLDMHRHGIPLVGMAGQVGFVASRGYGNTAKGKLELG